VTPRIAIVVAQFIAGAHSKNCNGRDLPTPALGFKSLKAQEPERQRVIPRHVVASILMVSLFSIA
jgi:hypothetical protein